MNLWQSVAAENGEHVIKFLYYSISDSFSLCSSVSSVVKADYALLNSSTFSEPFSRGETSFS